MPLTPITFSNAQTLVPIPETSFPPIIGTASATLTGALQLSNDAFQNKTYRVAHNKEELLIEKIGFTITTFTGGTGTLLVRVMAVDIATGVPSTLFATGSDATATIANGYQEVTLTTPVTIPVNTYFAVGFEYSGGSAGNTVSILAINIPSLTYSLPYHALFNPASSPGNWTQAGNTGRTITILANSTEYYRIIGIPLFSATGVEAFDQNTSPDEIGNRFIMPYTAYCSGGWLIGGINHEPMTFNIYDSAWNLLSSVTLNKNTQAGGGCVTFGTDPHITLHRGREYYVTLKAGSYPVDANLSYFDTSSAAMMAASLGGVDCYRIGRTDNGSVTINTLRQMLIGVRLDKILI